MRELDKAVDELIDRMIAEDIGAGDVTSEICIPETAIATGEFILKEAGVLAGLPFLQPLFRKINPNVTVTLYVNEGSSHKAGTALAKVSGPARAILSGERIALNLIQHASGIATQTASYVSKLAGISCAILDTRKTLPGLRTIEKYAVRVGGGINHRFGLDDRIVIKINHRHFFGSAQTKPLAHAVKKARTHYPNLPLEVEASNLMHVEEVLSLDVDAIMLTRMTPQAISRCVQRIRKTEKKVYIESLGTISQETVRAYAETGVDGISIGLTPSSLPLDIALRIK